MPVAGAQNNRGGDFFGVDLSAPSVIVGGGRLGSGAPLRCCVVFVRGTCVPLYPKQGVMRYPRPKSCCAVVVRPWMISFGRGLMYVLSMYDIMRMGQGGRLGFMSSRRMRQKGLCVIDGRLCCPVVYTRWVFTLVVSCLCPMHG